MNERILWLIGHLINQIRVYINEIIWLQFLLWYKKLIDAQKKTNRIIS